MTGPLFFNKKYINGSIFLDSYMKGPIFLTSSYMHIFFAQRFFEAAYPLCITWIVCDICVTTSKKWVQKIKGQYMNRSTFYDRVRFFKGQVSEWGKVWNTGSHTRTKITLKLPPPPPPPTRPTELVRFCLIIVSQKQDLIFHANCLHWTICIKCQILFSGKIRNTSSICRLLA